jgi:flagellar biosynthesis protein FlhG
MDPTTTQQMNSQPDALSFISKKAAYAARIVPLKFEGRTLVCMGASPVDMRLVKRLELEISREIQIIETDRSWIDASLAAAYGPEIHEDAFSLVDAVAHEKKPGKAVDLSDTPRKTLGPMKVIAVTSGKGGVGKTSITASLGVALSKKGYRVGIIDCDFGLSNLHVLFGIKPRYNLGDVVAKRVGPLAAFEPVAKGLYLLAGPAGGSQLANLDYAALQASNAGFSMMAYAFDYLLLDTGSGVHEGVLSLLLAADEVIMVTTPDPSAVLDSYVTARAILDRRRGATIRLIANSVKSATEAKEISAKFMTFIGINTSGRAEFLGKVQHDRTVIEAGRTKSPFLLHAPNSAASRDLQIVACRAARIPVTTPKKINLIARFLKKEKAA